MLYFKVYFIKRKDDFIVREEKLVNYRIVGIDKDNILEKIERVVYEIKIIGGVVVKIFVKKV